MYEKMKSILFDATNSSPITLRNGEGKEIKFLQIYATTVEDDIYCILSPLVTVENIKPRTGFVYKLQSDGALALEDKRELSSAVFKSYYSALSAKEREGS